jgi:hypothetical protein
LVIKTSVLRSFSLMSYLLNVGVSFEAYRARISKF